MSTAAGPGGGTARGGGASAAPPPILPPPELAPADPREPSQRPVDAGHCAGLHALISTLPSPDREIVLLRVAAGVPIPDIVAALGVTPAAIHRAQQALCALQPAATAHGPPPATRGRVVVLPHARTEPTAPEPTTAAQEGPPA